MCVCVGGGGCIVYLIEGGVGERESSMEEGRELASSYYGGMNVSTINKLFKDFLRMLLINERV